MSTKQIEKSTVEIQIPDDVKVNLIIDKVFKKSYIIVQMKGTHDWYN